MVRASHTSERHDGNRFSRHPRGCPYARCAAVAFCRGRHGAAMVLVGGATRLTESGLSITEWQPVMGALPPLSEAQWLTEFHRYQQIPQYHELNSGMSLDAFKTIFWWEWTHRLLGRLIGVVFLAPIAMVSVARLDRAWIAGAALADLWPWRAAGRRRLVDGRVRPRAIASRCRNIGWRRISCSPASSTSRFCGRRCA